MRPRIDGVRQSVAYSTITTDAFFVHLASTGEAISTSVKIIS